MSQFVVGLFVVVRGVRRGRGYNRPLEEGNSVSQMSGIAYKLLFYLAAKMFTTNRGIRLLASSQVRGTIPSRMKGAIAVVIRSRVKPMTKTGIIIGKAAGKGVSSVSKGIILRGIPGGSALIVSFVNCAARRIGIDGRTAVRIGLIRSTGTLRRIIIVNCNSLSGGRIADTVASLGTSSLVINIDKTSVSTSLRNGVNNLIVGGLKDTGSNAAFRLHNVASVGSKGTPLVIVSNFPNNSVHSLARSSVGSVSILGSTSTNTVCKAHTTTNIVLVAAGDNSSAGKGIELACDGRFAGGRGCGTPRVLSNHRCTRRGVNASCNSSAG